MTDMSRWGRRAHATLHRQALEAEMDEEMRFHLEMEVEDRVRSGMTPEEARRTALRDFGRVERVKEEARDARGMGWWEALGQDTRYSFRTLRRNPAFGALAILTLALGIGAATAIFSVVQGVLLRPLPFPEPERLVQVWQLDDDANQSSFSHPNFADLRERSRSFTALAEYNSGEYPVAVGGEAARVPVVTVSEDFFRVLGVQPARGRGFAEEEARTGAPVALVSEGFWQQYLGGSPDLAARPLRIGGQVHTVVGVVQGGLAFPEGANVWVPQPSQEGRSRTAHGLRVIGRLRDGTTAEAAGREVNTIAAELKRLYGDDTWMAGAAAVPLHEQMVGRVRPALLILLGASGLLLLIACANVLNLLLTRMAGRRRELALRTAVGAGRGRLLRQFVTESLVLTLSGGALGMLLAFVGVRMLLAMEPGRLPRLAGIEVNAPVLGFAVLLSVLTAAAMGVLVAARATDTDVREALAEGSRGASAGAASQRVRAALAAGQIALTLILLIGAGLLTRSFLRLLAVDPGYRTGGAVVMDLVLPYTDDEAETARVGRFHEELLTRIAAERGVSAVGSVNVLPLGGTGGSNGSFLVMDGLGEITTMEQFGELMKDPVRTGSANYRLASEGYFRAMEIPLVRGRLFDERDVPDAPHVAVINETLARTKWPGEDPIGKTIQYGNMDGDLRLFTIVGVVGDVREAGLDAEPEPTFYANSRQRLAALGGPTTVVIQGGGDPARIVATARNTARALDPEVPIRFRTLEEVFASSLAERRFSLVLLGAFAAVALVLAVTGIYGVISFLVAQRTREIGIRLALGARGGDVMRMVVQRGVRLALIGVGVGLVAALAGTRLLSGLLYGVSTTDLVTFLAVPLLLTGVAALASWLPARRTTRVDPMIAMRAE